MDLLVGHSVSVPNNASQSRSQPPTTATSLNAGSSGNTVSNSGSRSSGGQQIHIASTLSVNQSQPFAGAGIALDTTVVDASSLEFASCDPLHAHANMAVFQLAAATAGNQLNAAPWGNPSGTGQQPMAQQTLERSAQQNTQQLSQQLTRQNAQQPSQQQTSPQPAQQTPQQTDPQTVEQSVQQTLQQQQQQQTLVNHLMAQPQHAQLAGLPQQHHQHPLFLWPPPAPPGGAVITGANGQPMIMSPSATSSILQQQQQQQQLLPQQYITTGVAGAPVPLTATNAVAVYAAGAIPNPAIQQQEAGTSPNAAQLDITKKPSNSSHSNPKQSRKRTAAGEEVVAKPQQSKRKTHHHGHHHHHHHSSSAASPTLESQNMGETVSASSPAVISASSSASGSDSHEGTLSTNTNEKKGQPPLAIKSEGRTATSAASSMPSVASTVVEPQDIKPKHDEAAYAKMTASEKRRYDRNLREQQRSYKISQQIKELRSVLAESNVPFKPNKFSILLSVVDYIKQLQSRALILDAEHVKLINTIRQTNEMVNAGGPPESSTDCTSDGTAAREDLLRSRRSDKIRNDTDLLFVKGIDYSTVFSQCTAALGVAALDGRFLACNAEFEIVSGYSRDELLRQSLFNLLTSHDMEEVFKVMGEMLKSSVGGANEDDCDGGAETPKPLTHWSGVVSQKHQNVDLKMNITLTRTADGMPKFFNCALTTNQ